MKNKLALACVEAKSKKISTQKKAQKQKKRSVQFLIIGNGRVSRHLQEYFKLLKINYSLWSRAQSLEGLASKLKNSSHILLAIKDSEIESFYLNNLKNILNNKQIVIHFSGSQVIKNIYDLHPLMTFSSKLYSLETYKQIPFITTCRVPMQKLLPGLKNKIYRIKPSEKSKYHALCVLGGNFTNILIQKMIKEFLKFGLPTKIADLYITQTIENVLKNPNTSLTGPLVRRDYNTINANLSALKNDPFNPVYKAFVQSYEKEFAQ